MDIFQKIQELANALENSSELKRLRESEKNMQSDQKALKLMNDFREKQLAVYHMELAGEDPSDKLTDELNQLRKEVQENLVVMDFLSAQEKMREILKQINLSISQVLKGDNCTKNSCSGCSGCHNY